MSQNLPGSSSFKNISANEVYTKLFQTGEQNNPPFFPLDVRTPEETDQGIIQGATIIDISNENFIENVSTLDKSKCYLIYCRSGVRSVHAANYLASQGFSQLYNMVGGILEWNQNGFPLQTK